MANLANTHNPASALTLLTNSNLTSWPNATNATLPSFNFAGTVLNELCPRNNHTTVIRATSEHMDPFLFLLAACAFVAALSIFQRIQQLERFLIDCLCGNTSKKEEDVCCLRQSSCCCGYSFRRCCYRRRSQCLHQETYSVKRECWFVLSIFNWLKMFSKMCPSPLARCRFRLPGHIFFY